MKTHELTVIGDTIVQTILTSRNPQLWVVHHVVAFDVVPLMVE